MAESQRVLLPPGGDAPLSQVETAGVPVRIIVAAETVRPGHRIERVRPRLDPRKNTVVIMGSRHVRDNRARRRLRIDHCAFVVHEPLSREVKGGLLARERTAERGLQETPVQILGRSRKRVPRGKERISVGHLERPVVPASPAALRRNLDPRLPRMLVQGGVGISIESDGADGRRRHFDLIAFHTVNDDGVALRALGGRVKEIPDHAQEVVGDNGKRTTKVVVHPQRRAVAGRC